MPDVTGTDANDNLYIRDPGDTGLGLSGDDEFSAYSSAYPFRAFGGSGRDVLDLLSSIKTDAPLEGDELDGVTFRGGRGYDTLDLMMIWNNGAREDVSVFFDLRKIGGTFSSVEALKVEIKTDLYGGSSYSGDLKVRGTDLDDIVEIAFEPISFAQASVSLGKGNDSLLFDGNGNHGGVAKGGAGNDHLENASEAVGTKLLGGNGNDVIVSNPFAMREVLKGGKGATKSTLILTSVALGMSRAVARERTPSFWTLVCLLATAHQRSSILKAAKTQYSLTSLI